VAPSATPPVTVMSMKLRRLAISPVAASKS
jgi:hypothetical protein